jgi:putative transposase
MAGMSACIARSRPRRRARRRPLCASSSGASTPFGGCFNDERPHEALGQTPPAAHYAPSARSYSGRLREPEYPTAWLVRRVRGKGDIKWRGDYLYLSEALAGEPIALEPTDDERWLLHYGPILLGTLDQRGKFARLRAGTRPRPEPQPQPPG